MGAESFISLRDENPKPVLGMLTVDTAAGDANTCVKLFLWLHFDSTLKWSDHGVLVKLIRMQSFGHWPRIHNSMLNWTLNNLKNVGRVILRFLEESNTKNSAFYVSFGIFFIVFLNECQLSGLFQKCLDCPDDCQFSGFFQNCPDFSRWLPIFWMISKVFGFFQMQMVTPDAANFVWQTNFCLGGRR